MNDQDAARQAALNQITGLPPYAAGTAHYGAERAAHLMSLFTDRAKLESGKDGRGQAL